MKKYYLPFLFSFLVYPLLAQESHEIKLKLSPLTRKYVHDFKALKERNTAPSGYLYKQQNNGKPYVSSLIKVSDASSVQKELDAIEAKVGTKAGNIWTVRLPYDKIIEFTEINGISYIQMDEPVAPHMDAARKTTRVDSVQKGINLPMKYSGKGVIMGVIDFGFDYNHPAFYDTLHANYRIKRVWEQAANGTAPAGYTYGNEITDTNMIKSHATDNPKQTHGSMVAGMAAGSGYGSNNVNNPYRGMAYETDLVLVGVRRDSIARQWMEGSFTDFLDGINYIFNYATAVGKPCVINISWGGQSGPHDGSTLFNEACNNITGPGKILVMSAGNDGEKKIHLSKTFTSTDTTLNTFLSFSSNVYKRTWVDIWGEPGKTFCGKITLFSNNVAGNTTNYLCLDDSIHDQVLISVNGQDTCFVQFINSTAESNGKPRMTIDIYNKASDSVGVSIMGNDGTIHTWDEYYYYGVVYGYRSEFNSFSQPGAVTGNTASTVSDMGAADSVLMVGAYASKVNYTDINGDSWTYSSYVQTGKLAPFSSRGPLIDGKIKPDITAPGLTIMTAVNSNDTSYTETGLNSSSTVHSYFDPILNKKFYYAEFTGTSASSPAAAGIVALMLQAKPTLGPGAVRDIIASTAITDNNTGNIPPTGNNNWGHGKINAYRAIKMILGTTGIYDYAGEKLDCELFPNPNNGSFTISYSSDKRRDLHIEVYNMVGGLIKSENWKINDGTNLYTIELSQVSSGVYLVKISSEQGFVTIRTTVN